MTHVQYKEYMAAVKQFMQMEGIENLTSESDSKPYFSWRPCECCGNTDGGNREDCSGYNHMAKQMQGPYSVCTDCVYFATYGKLDDATMQQVAESEAAQQAQAEKPQQYDDRDQT